MMKISSDFIRHHLAKERERNSPTAILFAQICLFSTSLFLHKTVLSSKRDARGTKTALAYHTLALLLPFSESVLSQLKISRRTNGCKVNIIANCSCLALAILFEKFYEKTLASLGVVLSMAVLVILLLVIIRPRSDLGLFGFLIGVTGSVSYNLFQFGYKTWVVAAICFVLLGFKFWLDYNWLAVEEENLMSTDRRSRENKTFSKSTVLFLLVSETLIVVVFFVYWDFHLLRITGCSRDSSNCTSSFLPWAICLPMLCLWFTVAIFRYLCVRGIDREEMSKKTEVKVDIESSIDQKTEENLDNDDKQLQPMLPDLPLPPPPLPPDQPAPPPYLCPPPPLPPPYLCLPIDDYDDDDDDDDDDESPDEIEVKVDDKSNEEIDEVVLGTSEEVEDKVDDDEDMVIKSGRQEMGITLDTLRQRHNNPEEDRKRVANTTKESEGEGSEKTLKKSRSTFRTKSDSDTLDDGYKWRKSGKN